MTTPLWRFCCSVLESMVSCLIIPLTAETPDAEPPRFTESTLSVLKGRIWSRPRSPMAFSEKSSIFTSPNVSRQSRNVPSLAFSAVGSLHPGRIFTWHIDVPKTLAVR